MGNRKSIPKQLNENPDVNSEEKKEILVKEESVPENYVDPLLLAIENNIGYIPRVLTLIIYNYLFPLWKDNTIDIYKSVKPIYETEWNGSKFINSLKQPRGIVLIGVELFVLSEYNLISVYDYATGEHLRMTSEILDKIGLNNKRKSSPINHYLTKMHLARRKHIIHETQINTITSDPRNGLLYIGATDHIIVVKSNNFEVVRYFKSYNKISQSYAYKVSAIVVTETEVYVTNQTDEITVFNIQGKLIHEIIAQKNGDFPEGSFHELAVSNDKTKLYAKCYNTTSAYLYIIDVKTKKLLSRIFYPYSPCHCIGDLKHGNICVLTNGNIIISQHNNHFITILSSRGIIISGDEETRIKEYLLKLHSITFITCMPDGRLIVGDKLFKLTMFDIEKIKKG